MMFTAEPSTQESVPTTAALKLALTVAVAGILFVGVLPSPLLDAAKNAAAVFAQ
jgi:NADH:ubiquinone oxidoreductase subunit 2 (subunit N)